MGVLHLGIPCLSVHGIQHTRIHAYLSEAGGVDGLTVVVVTEVEIVDVEGAPRDTHAFSHLVVLTQPTATRADSDDKRIRCSLRKSRSTYDVRRHWRMTTL